MRANQSCLYTGVHRAGERYYVNELVVYPGSGARVKRKYFHTVEEAIAYRRANKECVK